MAKNFLLRMNKMFNKNLEIEFFDNYYKSGYDVFLEKNIFKSFEYNVKAFTKTS